jgi:site-specific recombinase XerC
MTPIAPLIEAFLRETLAQQRGVSRHTCDSYALSFQLLFEFAAVRLKIKPSKLTLENIDAGLALQLRFCFEVRSLSDRLVSSSPERPCDDVRGLDPLSSEPDGDAADFLD